MYNSDFPISTQSEDALGRASYARNLARTITKYGIVDSLCIGLLGPWGCGKTSILNMMIEEIEEIDREANSLLVIRFEPWNFTSTDQLLNQFFMVLANELSVTKWTGSAITYELSNKYLEHTDDDVVRFAIETCVENERLLKLTEYEQASAAAYYLLKVKSAESERRERAMEGDVKALLASWIKA